MSTPHAASGLQALLDLPDVAARVEQARAACAALRFHEGLRRRVAEAAAESRVRGARSSALLEGAELAGSVATLAVVRDLVRGAQPWPRDPGPAERVTMAAVRVTLATERIDAAALRSPAQVLAGLHVAAAADLVPPGQLGRPRRDGEPVDELTFLPDAPPAAHLPARLSALTDLLAGLSTPGAPVVVVAALAHAEVVAMRPFTAGNALVARALERAVLTAGGVDPTGVSVPEAGHAAGVGGDYRGALTAYLEGGAAGVRLWLLHVADAVLAGAGEGERIATAVRAGRLDPPNQRG